MLILSLILGCEPENVVNDKDTDADTGSGWGDADTDTDTDSDTHTGDTETGGDTDTDTETGGDTDSGTVPETPSVCQSAMMATDPAYPVFPAWDGREYDNFTVTLTGATKQFVTVAWASANSTEGWFISCAEIVDGTTAIVRVEPTSPYDASTFSNTDPGDGTAADHNGFWWYPWSVTGGDLGGTQYARQVDGEIVHLVAVTPPPAE